jgi:replicative DNA helicase
MKKSTTTPLPNNFLAEQAILNLLVTNPLLINEIILDLKPESFYFEPHKLIYETILEIYESNTAINLTNIITFLQDKNILNEIGGVQRIISIISGFENYSDLDNYVKQINDKYLRRLIIDIGKQIITWGYTTSEDLESILDKMEQSIFSLNQQNLSKKDYVSWFN